MPTFTLLANFIVFIPYTTWWPQLRQKDVFTHWIHVYLAPFTVCWWRDNRLHSALWDLIIVIPVLSPLLYGAMLSGQRFASPWWYNETGTRTNASVNGVTMMIYCQIDSYERTSVYIGRSMGPKWDSVWPNLIQAPISVEVIYMKYVK